MANVYEAPQSDLRPAVDMIEHQTLANPIAWNGRIGRLRFILQLQAMFCLSFILAIALTGIYRVQRGLPNMADSDTSLLISVFLVPSTLFSLVFCCRRRLQDLNFPSWLGYFSLFVYAALVPQWMNIDSRAFNEIVQTLSIASLFFLLCLVLAPARKQANAFGLSSPANTLRIAWYLLPTTIVASLLFMFRS